MSKKTVVAVDMLCSGCKKKVMKLVAGIEGISSIVLDSSKGLVTVVGDADPCEILKKLRKFRRSAALLSVGPPKPEEKKSEKIRDDVGIVPKTCHKCDARFVVTEDDYSYCSIL